MGRKFVSKEPENPFMDTALKPKSAVERLRGAEGARYDEILRDAERDPHGMSDVDLDAHQRTPEHYKESQAFKAKLAETGFLEEFDRERAAKAKKGKGRS